MVKLNNSKKIGGGDNRFSSSLAGFGHFIEDLRHPEASAEGSLTNIITPTSKSKISVIPRGEDMKVYQRKVAFTLAEVLITLGIIGVVAAMTIPNLIQDIKDKRTYTQLKTTHSILSNALRLAEEEYGDMTGWEGFGTNASESEAIAIANVLKQFLKFAIDCGTYDQNGFCTPKVSYTLLNGGMHGAYYNDRKYYKIKLLNGTSIWWRSGNAAEFKYSELLAVFFIDTNEVKLPNQVGRDLFLFTYEKGSLRPEGAPGYVQANTCKLNAKGFGCAYFVLTNKHMKYPKQ